MNALCGTKLQVIKFTGRSLLSQQKTHAFRSSKQPTPPLIVNSPFTPPTTTRRSIIRTAGNIAIGISIASALGAAAIAAAAAMNNNNTNDPQALVRQGMAKFVKGDVEGSLVDFDAALEAKPSIKAYLWQRGLTLYYLNQYEKGAEQFRADVAVNPNDTEESIWTFLCEAQLDGPSKARENFLQVGRDPRPVLRAAYEAFKNGTGTDAILQAAGGDLGIKIGGHDAFYGLLYVGLYSEAEGEVEKAKEAMIQAVNTKYGQGSGDYMASLAKVHCMRRGWL